jgi:MFS family permease
MPEAASAAPARVRTRTFQALIDNPAYRRFYLGQGVSLIGTWLQDAAVSWIVFDMTRSERTSGIVSACGVLPGLFVGLFAGALADRVRPRRLILAMQVAQMALAFLLAVLIALSIVRIWQMALILALTRVFVTFEMPSRQVFLYDLVGRSALMNAIALNSGLFNASRVVGPALAGLCLARFGPAAPFWLNGVSFLAAIGTLLTIRAARKGQQPAPHSEGVAEVFQGLAFLRSDRRVRSLYLLMAFFGVVGMGYVALVPAYARVVVHTETVGYSLLLSCGGVGATVGALVVASLGGLRRKEVLVLSGMALFGASLAAGGFFPVWLDRSGLRFLTLPVASLCLFGAGFGGIIFYSATQTLIQTGVPDHLRGRIMGIWMIVYSASVPLGSLWAGQLAQSFGVPVVLGLSAVLCIGTAAAATVTRVLEEPRRALAAAP